MRSKSSRTILLALLVLPLVGITKVNAADCSNGNFDSTFALIQKAIFENRGCTNDLCHGSAATGGLDLRPDVAYDNLIDVKSPLLPEWTRVRPGRRDQSLLFINVAAKTDPTHYTAPLRAMPLDPQPALSANEVEALRRWIEAGAPKDGVIKGTADLLDACLPPPEPIAIKPLEPPAPGTGVQIRMPKTILPPRTEHEVCFVSYYDLTDQVPAEFRGPDGTTFRYKRNEIRQDPLSHHLIVSLYQGQYPPTAETWGEFTCDGGAKAGQTCPPTDTTFCGEGLCSTTPQISIACIGFGPSDAAVGLRSAGFTGTQETAAEFNFPEGVYREVPLKGMIIWNSHAFNVSDQEGKVEAWLNFQFAPPEDQQIPAQQIFNANDLFKMSVPVFKTQEICSPNPLPKNTQVYELSSHAHQRMKRWRTFMGAWTCDGGPADGASCSPVGYDFVSPDVCQGSPCKSMKKPNVSDCNGDGEVTIDELLRSVNIALESASIETCTAADNNYDDAVTIDEVTSSVNAALAGVPGRAPRDPMQSLLYTSLIYNDPIVLRFDQPLSFRSAQQADRTLTYCALYDNGYIDPTTVKKQSTSPRPPLAIPGVGGPCQRTTGCTAGKVGMTCSNSTVAKQRDASCDTTPGAGDGLCDGCLLTGGVTTEDEMFLLMGQFFVAP